MFRLEPDFSNGVGTANDAAIVLSFDSAYFSLDGLHDHAKVDYGFALTETHG